ncbi:MAG: PrsW family glutamic-type intramembrane protease [Clostridia bacterium]
MRCNKCGSNIKAGESVCPNCGAKLHYGGNTEFYGKVASASLTFKDVFADTFKRHNKGDGAKLFMAGTPISTPAEQDMLEQWQRPWLFVRIGGVGVLFVVLMYILVAMGVSKAVPALLFLGGLVVPLAILTFFWEMNIHRDIPLYTVLLVIFIGGALSIVINILLRGVITISGAIFSPLFEEPAKVIALAIFVKKLDCKHILGGMLIGAAVGTGFEIIENAGYVFESEMPMALMMMRSVHSLGGHIMWAAMTGGSLVWAKGNEKLNVHHFGKACFLTYFAIAFVLHMLWNSGISIAYLPIFGDIWAVLLIIAALLVVFSLFKKALSQVLSITDIARFKHTAPPCACNAACASRTIIARTGPLAGGTFEFEDTLVIGRSADQCNIIFPDETMGVSRRHCTLQRREQDVYIMDNDSTNGTFLENGKRLPADSWIKLDGPFYLGSKTNMFDLR